MSRISTLLSNILSAVYGRDVRQSIHDAIGQCYTDVSAAKTLADSSVVTMTQKITDCDTAAEGARTAANTANASACDTAVSELPNQVSEVFADLGLTMENGKLCVEVVRE